MFLSARGQATEHVLNIQTETSEESEKALTKWKKVSSFETVECGKEE